MPPQFVDQGVVVRHPIEQMFNASGWDILEAIQRGFRAQVDVKGKLAELFLYRHLAKLLESGFLTKLEWRDQDGVADFLIRVKRRELQIECKNVRSGKAVYADGHKVEIQKTRSQIGGGPARGYKADEFDMLAACLFNQTGEWKYLYCATRNLERRPQHPDYLVVMHKVPYRAQAPWHDTIEEAIADVLREKR